MISLLYTGYYVRVVVNSLISVGNERVYKVFESYTIRESSDRQRRITFIGGVKVKSHFVDTEIVHRIRSQLLAYLSRYRVV